MIAQDYPSTLGSELSLKPGFLTPCWESFPCATFPLQGTETQRCHPGLWLMWTFPKARHLYPVLRDPHHSLNQQTHPKKKLTFSAWDHGKEAVELLDTTVLETASSFSWTPQGYLQGCLSPGISPQTSWWGWEVRSYWG